MGNQLQMHVNKSPATVTLMGKELTKTLKQLEKEGDSTLDENLDAIFPSNDAGMDRA